MSGIGLNPKTQITCPACEYDRSDSGKPVSENAQMRCLACGNIWKEYNNSPLTVREPLFANPVIYKDETTGSLNAVGFRSGTSGTFGMAVLSLLFLLGVGAAVLFLRNDLLVPENRGLHVESLRFEELIRSGRGKVVRVQGVIANSGSDIETLPRVAIVLRKSNGDELTRWYYQSALFKLNPGARTRFVSSIQYDTPVIASVEALFE